MDITYSTPRTDAMIESLDGEYDSDDANRNKKKCEAFMRLLEIELQEANAKNARLCAGHASLMRDLESAYAYLDTKNKE